MDQPAPTMLKFCLALRTRDGQVVENIMIAARAPADAERKLRQMYRLCEVLRCEEVPPESKLNDAMSFEDFVTLLSE